MLQSAIDVIIKLSKIDVQIKDELGTLHDVEASQSNHFRMPMVDENIVASGREYVISNKDLAFTPKRGHLFIISSTEYFSIAVAKEMRAFGQIIAYRLVME